MTALIILATILVALAGYLMIGVRVASRSYITREVERHCRKFPTLARDPGQIDEWRREAAADGLFLALIWPFYLIGRALTGRLAANAPLSSVEAKELIKQRDRRIVELEREMGLR